MVLMNPMVIGGEGMTVEIHQSCFTSKEFKGKTVSLQQQWAFGGVCRETGVCFLFAVAEPSAETLLEAVSGGVRLGSTILSDLFALYGGDHLLPHHYTLLSIKKSDSVFVNPTTGEEVEAMFASAKTPKRRKGENTLLRGQDSHLCEFLWRKRHENVVLVDQIYKDIAAAYPLQEALQ